MSRARAGEDKRGRPRCAHVVIRALLVAAACCLPLNPTTAQAAEPAADQQLAAALALKRDRRYPEARAALEAYVAQHPDNAEACHALGMVWKLRNDTAAYEEAVKWLRRAAELEPQNSHYVGDYGGTSLELAARTRSVGAATRGRDAMEKAIALNPDDIDARRGLYEFYRQAPWPLGSSARAAAQLAEIRKRSPSTALVLDINARAAARDYRGAFQLCEAVLSRDPDNYDALYYYGRTASVSGENLGRGLEALRKCLTLKPPSPASPTHRNVWNRISIVLEKLGRSDEAQSAQESARAADESAR